MHTQRSILDELFLYSKQAVVFSHPLASRKTPQLDKPDAESNSLKREKQVSLKGVGWIIFANPEAVLEGKGKLSRCALGVFCLLVWFGLCE